MTAIQALIITTAVCAAIATIILVIAMISDNGGLGIIGYITGLIGGICGVVGGIMLLISYL